MSILAKHLAFLRRQMEFHADMAGRFPDSPYGIHKELQAGFEALIADLGVADGILDEGGSSRGSGPEALKLSLTPKDLEGLPDEVLSELSISEGDKAEFDILVLLDDAGGVVSLDRLIVALWRKRGELHKRPALVSRLTRMVEKGLVYSVPGKQEVYSNRPIPDDRKNGTPGQQ